MIGQILERQETKTLVVILENPIGIICEAKLMIVDGIIYIMERRSQRRAPDRWR